MTRYTMTYQIEIDATSHDDAALKGIEFLTNDLINPYTELSVKTETPGHPWCNDHDFEHTKHNIIGITKDSRGRRTFTIVTDEDGNSSK